MSFIFNVNEIVLKERKSPVPEFTWHTSEKLAEITKSKYLDFYIRSLDPDKFSYPYHFHRDSEEIFVILAGEVTLRTPRGFHTLKSGDIIFFETGQDGAHQLYNHTDKSCRYLDIRTATGIDVCEYPDSGKINIIPYQEIYKSKNKADYYQDENDIRNKWPKEILKG